jgi:hypothetical protein
MFQVPQSSNSSIQFVIGQAVATLPKDARIEIDMQLDPTKTTSGTFGTEAVKNASGLMSVAVPADKKGTYSTAWTPTKTNGITFTISVDAGKITLSWKGTMKNVGSDTTIDVDAEANAVPLKK